MIMELPPRPEVLEMLTMIVEARNEREWRDQAACKGMDPALFFPARGGTARHITEQAKATCATCPVSTQCLNDNKHEYQGIWGGLSGRQRRKQGHSKQSFEVQYRLWIAANEPSVEIAAHDLGIQPNSINRQRMRTAKETRQQ